MNGAVRISWGSSVRGREGKALEVFGRSLEYFDELAKAGRISGYQTFISVSGRPGGMLLVEGDLETLMQLQTEAQMMALRREAALIVEDYDIQYFGGGDDQSLQAMVQGLTAALSRLELT
ncbi:MAG: hypothetical protein M3Z02_04905 [Actinomycetota bacterium]|nr:hypothetical protein [Actinomycetota bacterium]